MSQEVTDNLTLSLVKALSAGPGKALVQGAAGSCPAFVLSQIMRELDRPLLLVTPTAKQAEELYTDLLFFNGFLGYEGIRDSLALLPGRESSGFSLSLSDRDRENRRISLLARLVKGEITNLVTSVIPLSRYLIPRYVLSEYCQEIRVGQEIERDQLIDRLLERGYERVALVEGSGEFSVRGSIVDIFSPASAQPIRLEFFGDTVDSIREFDPNSQRSRKLINEFMVTPAGQGIFKPEFMDQALASLRQLEISYDLPKRLVAPLAERFKQGTPFPGQDYFLPLIYSDRHTLLDYFPPKGVLATLNPSFARKVQETFWREQQDAFKRARDAANLIMPPEVTQQETDLLWQKADLFPNLSFELLDAGEQAGERALVDAKSNDDLRAMLISKGRDSGIMARVQQLLTDWLAKGWRLVMVSATRHSGERLRGLLAEHGLLAHLVDKGQAQAERLSLQICVGDLSRGFRLEQAGLAFITEEEIFGQKHKFKKDTLPKARQAFSGLRELSIDDCVVHAEHGVGVYRGLIKLTFQEVANDFLALEYYGGDKLYLPVDRINLLSRYHGPDDSPPSLDRLGTRSWLKTKRRVSASLRKVAEELVKIYAQRRVLSGHIFSGRDQYLDEFEATFPYEETTDQLKAIEDVLNDMQLERPMDRLVCGDVGFGKTEVALRAGFKAVMDGKQVGVIVPTTVLAEQHSQNFSQRLSAYPIRVEVLSRFKRWAKQKETIAGLRDGSVDIVIGTHRLLQDDVRFKDLGLLVIDEEHRFGVRHKEKLKKLRALVDVITLTATPIPRTLQLSLVRIRDLSIIETPPEGRQAIETFIIRFDDIAIAQAIRRELARGGQVFFVHNRVQSIDRMAEHLKKLVPEAKVTVAHGQMEEQQLEKVMVEFLNRAYDILVCTTIIESGLDYPQANTIFINRADKFGLAQLYQLRGRVGRSAAQAYAYLIIPAQSLLTQDAQKRLHALMQLTELGSGFQLAAQDLEIRGAGNILGTAQSGHIRALGYDLYMDLLAKAVAELKGEEIVEEVEPVISLGISAYVPEEYVPDVNTRLVLYKRLAASGRQDELEDLKQEMTDRFGPLPELVITLAKVMGLRQRLKLLSANAAKRQGEKVRVEFSDDASVSLDDILTLQKRWSDIISLCPDRSFMVSVAGVKEEELLARLDAVLASLAKICQRSSS